MNKLGDTSIELHASVSSTPVSRLINSAFLNVAVMGGIEPIRPAFLDRVQREVPIDL